MKLFQMLLPVALTLAVPLAGQRPVMDPRLAIEIGRTEVVFEVTTQADPFLGVVLAAPSDELTTRLEGLPPLLANSLVLGYGLGQAGTFKVSVPEVNFPNGVFVYVQAVVVTDRIRTTQVEDFVLDPTYPQSP